MQVLIFNEGDQLYALNVLSVRELIVFGEIEINDVPGGLDMIHGMIHMRGTVITVINTFKLLNIGECDFDKDARIIILEDGNGDRYGMSCNHVEEIITIDDSDIQSSPSDTCDTCTAGVFNYNDDLVILLDENRIFNKVNEEDV